MVQSGMDYYRKAKQRIESQRGPDRQRYSKIFNHYNQLGYQAYLRKKQEEEAEEDALLALQEELSSKPSVSDKVDAKTKKSSKKKEDDKDGFFETIMNMGRAGLDITGLGLRALGQTINPFDGISPNEAIENVLKERERLDQDKGVQDLRNLTTSAVDAASFGALAPRDFEPEGGVGVAGQMIGSLAPGGLIAGALRGTRLGANTTRNMSTLQKAGQYAKEGAVAGGIYGTAEAGVTELINPEERNIYDHLRNIGLDTAFGAVADPALMGLGSLVGRGISNAIPTNRGRASANVFETANPVQPEVPPLSNVRNNLDIPDLPTAQSRIKQLGQSGPSGRTANGDPFRPVDDWFTTNQTRTATASATVDDVPTNRSIFDWGNRQNNPTEQSILSRADRALVETSDRVRGIKVTERKIASTGSEAFKNAYRDARLVPGAVGSGTQALQRSFTEPVRALEREGLDLREAFEYVASKHLLDVNANNPKYTNPGGANLAQLRDRVNRYSQNPLNQQFEKVVQDLQRDTLDLLRREGIISKDVHDELINKYPNYFPLFRSKGEIKSYDDMLDIFTSGNVRKAIHELGDGSEDLIKDPIDNLINYVMTAHQAAYTNRAFRHLTDLEGAKLNGQLLAKDVTGKYTKADSKRTVKFKVDGETKEYELHSDLFKAYSELKTVLEPNRFFRMVEGLAKFQRTAITGNPIFTVKQFSRDLLEGWTNGSFSMWRDFIPAMFDMFTDGMMPNSQLDNFFKHGAGYGNMVSMDRNQHNQLQRMANRMRGIEHIKEVPERLYTSTLGTLVEGLRRINEGAENLPKLAQFRATARRTGDLDQAAFEARDLMDFSMAGATTQKANRTIAFLNANIRGKERIARSIKDRPVQTLTKMATVGGGLSSLAYMAYDQLATDAQKEMIETAPEWLRQSYWLLPSPNGEDLIRIPKPYEVAALVSTPLEFALFNEHIVGPDVKEYIQNWASELFLADMTLNPATPLYEMASGINLFTGRSIDNPRESHLDSEDQGDVYTSSVASGISKATGGLLSPRRVDHLIQGYIPQSGENVTNVIDRLLEMGGVRENEKPVGATGLENLNPFFIDGATTQSDRIGHIYNAAEEAQALKKRTQESGEMFEFPNAYRAVNTIQSEDQDLARQIRMIDNDPNLSREEKQVLREDLIARRNEFANRQVSEGRTDTSEEGLARTEQEFAGLGVKPTRTDAKAVLTSQLVQFGVPRHLIDEVMSNTELTNQELAQALQQLLQQYTER